MGRIRCIFLILMLFIGGMSACYAQIDPPPPTASTSQSQDDICGEGNDGVPPPVGLCLPIDDYIYLLMAVGVMYGCYKARDFKSI